MGFGEVWKVTGAILARMAEVSAEAGADFVVVVIPPRHAVYTHGISRILQARTIGRVRGLLERQGIDHLDATPILSRQAAGPHEPLYYEGDGHLTAAGHRLLARAVHRHLAGEHDVERDWCG